MKVARVNQASIPVLTSPFGIGGTTPQPSFEDLSDVDMTGITDGEVPVWNVATGTWLPGAGGSGDFLTKTDGEGNTVSVNSAATGAVTIDWSLGNWFDLTLTGNVTYTFANVPAAGPGSIIHLIRRQGGSGGYTETFPAAVVFPDPTTGLTGGSQPALHTAVGAQNACALITEDGGTTVGFSDESPTASGGSVTSVALTVPAEFSVAGSPVTTTGTLAITKANESANTVWAGPTSGSAAAPTFRALVTADIPAGVGTTDHEHIDNVTFSGDGSTTAFELPAAPFDAYAVQAFVAGVRVPQTLSGTMLTTMTFDTAPASGTDNIVIDIVAIAA